MATLPATPSALLHCLFSAHPAVCTFGVQVRDTVELFCFRRQRKLSLRFLASYLLGITIQKGAGQVGAAAAAAAAAATSSSSSSTAAARPQAPAGGSSKADAASTAAAAAGGGEGVQRTGPAAGVAAVAAAAAAAASVQPGSQPGHGHDSIEDAATALALYNVYCKLVVSAPGGGGA
jgi:hypothetical protein